MHSYVHAALVLTANGHTPVPLGPASPGRRPPGGGLRLHALFNFRPVVQGRA